ncbi:MAG: hypothetical protein PHW60_09755 [Kiritimatiellae bacterium]|nr:hypothetical protein [Kiritimatiellia bacterium]
MKIWRILKLVSVPIVCLAALLAFSGCEGTTDEESSGVDAYLAAHPYASASRDDPLPVVLALTPLQATASIIGQTIAFTASGGVGDYHWGVSDPADGSMESTGANQALYICLQVGNNDVIVQDDGGHFAAAHISPVVNTMTISPASVSLVGGARSVSLAVAGGTPPYAWTSGNTLLGTVSYDRSSSYVAAYTAVAGAYGVNVITVHDAENRIASAQITQTP